MANAKTTTSIAYPLIVAAVFLAALPFITGQSSPPAPTPLNPSPAPGPFTPAPSPAVDCFTYLVNLSDCLTFVENDSNLTKPDPGCCPELANLVDTKPICLCDLIGKSGQVGISVDVSRALRLPSVCNVTTPPVSLCAAIGVPVSFGPSEAPSPADPSPGSHDNGSSSILASNQHLLIGLAVVLITYSFN
ncbi:hypothetical protein ACJIZ3_017455 [Penstemon smallii]|uniref:Bifunctional inhibitor/plant lipid transfer protein/seed storage helical domain-containing protein n=1 Tax=Penstemon smallii TaxID=265156 RepID=A0ABD3SW10_9LAMI